MEFEYKAIDKNNNVVEGKESAKSKFDLSNYLKQQGLILIDADEVKKGGKITLKKILSFGTISMHEKIVFTKNISAMLEAGLSLSRSLSVIEKQTKNKRFKKIIEKINTEIKKGSSFSAVLKKYPKIFNNLYTSMVRSGEETGELSKSLEEVGSQMEKDYLLKKKIKGAMIYPGVIITAMAGIGVFMMIYIVPTLTSTFEEIGSELPKSTRLVIFISDFFNENLILGIGIVVAIIVILYLMYKSKKGKAVLELVLLRVPVISVLIKETNSARTTRTLSSLLKAGVPYLEALNITKATITNSRFVKVLEKSEKQVEMGLSVATVFEENSNLYPIFVSEMIAVGEETGDLSSMLFKVAEFYEKEIEEKTKNISTIIEPVLMIFVGAAVGFFAISMISPMYSLVSEF